MSYIKVLDTETTGLHDPQIVEIGCCELNKNLKLVKGGIYGDLVYTDKQIDLGAMCIHNITPEMLEGKPTLEEVIDKYKPSSKTKYIVGHNIDAFDLRVLPEDFIEEGGDVRTLDTLKLARKLISKDYYGNHKNITLWYGLECYKTLPLGEFKGEAHRADFDCYMTASILVDLLKRYKLTVDEAYELTQPVPNDITVCNMKKHLGKKWELVMQEDLSYVQWIMTNIDWKDPKEKEYVSDLLKGIK